MKIELLFLGKTKDSYITQGINEYGSRIKHYTGLNLATLKVKRKKSWTEAQERQEEGRVLLAASPPSAIKVVLDSTGRQVTSEGLADLISRWEQEGRKQASFLIGGPTGHSRDVLDQADFILSLSRMTFTHDMIRLFLLEQLYRAYTIKAGEKYHK
ncbi:MAG TPA: 23S rRNA (pseudouridine(1915)-N(3))-methyltransferase RlmH [Desulfobacterales bacterium]|nr:23S rRNA (pseudouridine(1915)-N(3))-methyltransferase RlmH [Desulfobacterales bacterium]HIP37783.1 23S rRNA (pseudouridine(1915)-N(3))-methyltransferase RlmH [Desulfocapsa sulfexigens]